MARHRLNISWRGVTSCSHITALSDFSFHLSSVYEAIPFALYSLVDKVASLFFLNSGLWGYWHCGHPWPIVPASGDSEDDCGEADGMYIGRGNRSSRRKPAPAPLLYITKSHMTRPGFQPRPPRWEAGD
jgi:hypothetical protein